MGQGEVLSTSEQPLSMLTVRPALPAERPAALSFLFDSAPPYEGSARLSDALASAAQGGLSLDGLLIAERDGEPVGSAVFLVQPDGTGFVWPPGVPDSAAAESVADALLAEVCRRLDTAGARLGQCLVSPSAARDRARLKRHGFAHVCDLGWLHRSLWDPLPPLEPRDWEAVPFLPGENDALFAEVLDRTYVGTQDCPALNPWRSGASSLAGHRLTGRFDPARWHVFRERGEAVGVLLLAEHPELRTWELIYLGVVPEARGRGLGRALALTALHAARAEGCEAVFLAVDRRNDYAMRVYERLTFVEQETRAVHVRPPGGGHRQAMHSGSEGLESSSG